jgi:phosphoglycolate phosphatase
MPDTPTIVFDLDGTLVDTAPDINAIANKVLGTEGAAPISLADTRSFIGNGTGVFVERMAALRNIGEDAERLARMKLQFEDVYTTACEFSQLYPGVRDMLNTLKADGNMLGVCTNKPIAPTHFLLDQFAITGLFGVVLGGDSLPERKPDPTPLLHVFDALGAGQNRLYVGDSEVDAETAQRARTPFVLYTKGYRKTPAQQLYHTHLMDDFADLAGIVAAQFAA